MSENLLCITAKMGETGQWHMQHFSLMYVNIFSRETIPIYRMYVMSSENIYRKIFICLYESHAWTARSEIFSHYVGSRSGGMKFSV